MDCDSGRKWTAKQLFDAIITLSVRFLEYGISKGNVVACFCTNSDYHLITMLSLWSIGTIYAGLFFKSLIRELQI
ncbi:hypothetical protein B4U80_14513 [Leptotrombidium deliense]|uniref:AMP-dependent synthetase/ligase domain-containing protein n=1 Tax=Leptotrombidium deliense TaxID=299467 RepID=A0A443RV46_9ACAR|nr:hypothetical protein B4U80_14513 [Leptotrombidium deliense]